MTSDDQRPAEPAQPVPPTPDPARSASDPARSAPDPARPVPDRSATETPDADTLASIATPATVRRAPRIGAFIRAGVLLGAVIGLVAALLGTGTDGEGRTAVILLSTVGVAGFGALLGAAVAARLDRGRRQR